ncbi:MAG: hypothetical protein AAF772_01570 [Acidobacteriota bacterium]
MIHRIVVALVCLAAFALLAAGPARADSCQMKFYITNNTDREIEITRIAYKHHNSSWSDGSGHDYGADYNPGVVDERFAAITNYVHNCKKKRRVKIVARCLKDNGSYSKKEFTSGWIKNGGSNMKVGFTYDECPHVKGPKVRDWD